MKIKYMEKVFIRIILLVIFFALFNINKSFALTTKEEVREYVSLVEENFQKDLKDNNMKDGRIHFGSYFCDRDKNKKYISCSSSMIPESLPDNYYQMEDTVKEVFREYFDKNLDFNLSDEERIVDYIITGGSTYTRAENYKYGDDIEGIIGAIVFPASEKTIWAKDTYNVVFGEIYNKKTKDILKIDGYATKDYYIHLKMQDGKYVITYLDTVPEGYYDFVERMKNHDIDLENLNYAELINSKTTTEVIAEAVQKENFEIENVVKTKSQINFVVILICSFGIIGTTFMNIKCIKKLKRK